MRIDGNGFSEMLDRILEMPVHRQRNTQHTMRGRAARVERNRGLGVNDTVANAARPQQQLSECHTRGVVAWIVVNRRQNALNSGSTFGRTNREHSRVGRLSADGSSTAPISIVSMRP